MGRFIMLLLSTLLTSKAVFANPLSKAWECAKAKVQMDYLLLKKGAQAANVMSSSPVCVSKALALDPSLVAVTSTLFAVNAIRPNILPASSCNTAVQKTATYPIAMAMNDIFPGVIPDQFKDEANAQAQAQLWNFLSTTPPISAAISQVQCGCTFLEAGLSIENLLEVLNAIASTGKTCEKILQSIPGYNAAKTHLNNLAEDLFTDQYPHKNVAEYYNYDFGGCENCFDPQSHAIAKILNPNHNPRLDRGAQVFAGLYMQLNKGAESIEGKKKTCKLYFDSHKMSAENAEKVCESLSKQFENDIQSKINSMLAKNTLIEKLEKDLNTLLAFREADCDQIWPNQPEAFLCKQNMRAEKGSFIYPNPYEFTGSLGTPLSKDVVDGIIQQSTKKYFLNPLFSSGASSAGFETLVNNGYNVETAYKVAISQYLVATNAVFKNEKFLAAKKKQVGETQLTTQFMNEVGNSWGSKCPSKFSQICLSRLRQAWDVCNLMISQRVPNKPGSGDVIIPDPVLEAQYKNKFCKASYDALINKFLIFSSSVLNANSYQEFCPKVEGQVVTACKNDVDVLRKVCAGGVPFISVEFHDYYQVSANPKPSSERVCNSYQHQFKSKWQSQSGVFNQTQGAKETALHACRILQGAANCGPSTQAAANMCERSLTSMIRTDIWPKALGSDSLESAIQSTQSNAVVCSQKVVSLIDRWSTDNLDTATLRTYGARCPYKAESAHIAAQCREDILRAGSSCRTKIPGRLTVEQYLSSCRQDLSGALGKYLVSRSQ